jgi:hypothetical protein
MGKNRLEAFSDSVIAIIITMNGLANPSLRRMMKSSWLFLAFGISLQANAESSAVAGSGWYASHGNGSFSAAARKACAGAGSRSDVFIRSPNRKKMITVKTTKDEATTLAVDEGGRKFTISTEGWPCPEIGWSPASDVFFVNYSDGGAIGTYHVAAYQLSKGRLAEIRLASEVRRDFLERYPKCFSPEEPNIAGIAWANSATRLLIAAQVIPHSNCDNMGTFMLYEVAVPSGKVIRRFSQIEAKALFYNLLGPELRSADDSCLSDPSSCLIPMLHEGAGR